MTLIMDPIPIVRFLLFFYFIHSFYVCVIFFKISLVVSRIYFF